MNLSKYRFLICGYGLPAEIGITTLFGLGCKPSNIALLTHEADSRNSGLISLAKLRNIPFSIDNPTNQDTINFVKNFKPDILISLHYRMRIPKEILSYVNINSFNLHPSLLPKYRGTNSVSWCLINGEKQTGFTFHYMEEAFDTGNIILQEKIEIGADDTAFSLFHRQIASALPRLPEVIQSVLEKKPGVSQIGEPTYFPRKLPFDGIINPYWSSHQIDCFIRALYFPPFEPAILLAAGQRLPIYSFKDYLEISKKMALELEEGKLL